jgi:adenylosuccinate lyase
MIERYWRPEMKKLWKTSEQKFAYWLRVEIAVLYAREKLGQIPAGTAEAIEKMTWIDERVVRAIERRDREINHDLNAFVEIMRLQCILERSAFEQLMALEQDEDFNSALSEALAKQAKDSLASWFHDGMTSYDTEEPAMSLLLIDSAQLISAGLEKLLDALEGRAMKHRGQLCIGRTHVQHAQPTTFGIKCVVWADLVNRALAQFDEVVSELLVMKLSGAVGVYGTLGPEVEALVGERLQLEPAIATQILSLDRRARLVNELAIVAGVCETIGNNLWLLSKTEVGEVREPFGKRQKGSSAMPHKKNPITLERIKGLPRLVRGYAHAMMECMATAHERDISHSSVERMAMADAFGLTQYLLFLLSDVVERMEVFPERMLENIEMTHGIIASQRVEMLLKEKGMPAETAYRTAQRLSNRAVETRTHLRELLKMDPAVFECHLEDADIAACFDWSAWVEHEAAIYEMAGL